MACLYSVTLKCNVGVDDPQPNRQPNWEKLVTRAYLGKYDNMACFTILWSNVMTELMSPSLTGTKTGCLFGDVGHIFCVLIKVSWLVWR